MKNFVLVGGEVGWGIRGGISYLHFANTIFFVSLNTCYCLLGIPCCTMERTHTHSAGPAESCKKLVIYLCF
jgi:hypothetical protein